MIPLDSTEWSQLSHAYGNAIDIPGLLVELESMPPDEGSETEPYYSLCSALCHQGDVYTASYAALPHLVRLMKSAPEQVPVILMLLVTRIEIARLQGRGPDLPSNLEPGYRLSLEQLPGIVSKLSQYSWDNLYCCAAIAAVAASKGFHQLAETVLELDPETIEKVLHNKFGEG
jgi:hypothetical protein